MDKILENVTKKVYIIIQKCGYNINIIGATEDEEYALKYCEYRNSAIDKNDLCSFDYKEIVYNDSLNWIELDGLTSDSHKGFEFTFKEKKADEPVYSLKDIIQTKYGMIEHNSLPHMENNKTGDEFNHKYSHIKCYIPSKDGNYIQAMEDLKELMESHNYTLNMNYK